MGQNFPSISSYTRSQANGGKDEASMLEMVNSSTTTFIYKHNQAINVISGMYSIYKHMKQSSEAQVEHILILSTYSPSTVLFIYTRQGANKIVPRLPWIKGYWRKKDKIVQVSNGAIGTFQGPHGAPFLGIGPLLI